MMNRALIVDQCRRRFCGHLTFWMVSVLVWTLVNGTTAQEGGAVPLPAKHPAAHEEARFDTTRGSSVRLPLPAESDAFTFVIFGDRTGGPADGVKILAQAVRDVNLLDPDMVMTIGDMVQGYNDTEPWMVQMREYKGIMDGLRCPWFPTPGNHDLYSRDTAKREVEYEASFGPLWYSFEHKGCRFIVLCTDEGDPATGRKGFGSPDTQKMSDTQFEWLKQTLEAAKDARHVFVFQHHPRWLGATPHGNYGDVWERVHKLLAASGKVRAVFCGHWHRMRHDGLRDGIEYVQLASTGGHQEGHAPEGGWLHQFHAVTVRGDDISMAAIPVGQVMDVRRITRTLSEDTELLGNERPRWIGTPTLHLPDDGTGSDISFAFRNPARRAVGLNLRITDGGSRMIASPDGVAVTLEPGAEQTFTFKLHQAQSAHRPELVLKAEYLADGWRVPMRELRLPLPLKIKLPGAEAAKGVNGALNFDGAEDCVAIASEQVPLADGPFTLEAWFKPRAFTKRMALVAKSQNSDYAIFVNNGKPHFAVFLGEGYVSAAASAPIEAGVWHHAAGVYDGSEVRLYIDGKLAGRGAGSGSRRTNALDLLIGADPDSGGRATSFFDGLVDAVRLSGSVLYSGEAFEPLRQLPPGADTVLLLNFDRAYGPYHPDDSGREAHGVAHGEPTLESQSDR